ncbi:MAG: metallophosphoesterase family protein [Proteobacteria bacterium]|nr:metallophosphoesterase family protein [Pseudomonadota bacterium]
MKIALLSDIHLSVGPMALPAVAADVLVIAGDVGRPARAMEWAKAARVPTLYVAGNHEFYGSDLVTTHARLVELAEGSNVRVLERSEWHHGNVRFLGCTLWSDYRLLTEEEARARGIADALKFLYDFSAIRLAPGFEDKFTPAASQLLFDQSVAWLEECFARPHAGPTVVITHFAPTPQSISPRFKGSSINASFVSDLTDRIARWQPALWMHGHTHDSFDYRVGATRVVCNARGYVQDNRLENGRFDPAFIVEV